MRAFILKLLNERVRIKTLKAYRKKNNRKQCAQEQLDSMIELNRNIIFVSIVSKYRQCINLNPI